MQKRNFKTKAHLAAAKDESRPAMNYIIFEDGNLIVTDSCIMVVQSLLGHGFTNEEIDHLEGKAIHREAFQEILRYHSIEVGTTGIIATKGRTKVVFPLETLEDQCSYSYPNYKAVMPDLSNTTETYYIGLDLNLLARVKDLTLNAEGKVMFNLFGRNKCVICGVGVDELILLIALKTD